LKIVAQQTMNAAKLTEGMFKAINSHDLAGIGKFLADDVQAWDPLMPAPIKGRKAVEEYFRGQFRTFPDANIKVLNHIENPAGDTVATEMEWTGTQRGPIENPGMPTIPPTNKRVSGKGVIVGRARNGKVASFSVYYDTGSMMQQLGLMPGAQ